MAEENTETAEASTEETSDENQTALANANTDDTDQSSMPIFNHLT